MSEDSTNTSAGSCYTTSGSGVYITVSYDSNACTAGGSSIDDDGTPNGTTIIRIVPPPPPRRILVTMPDSWDRKKHEGFADLLNHRTRTGWIVGMIIFGEVIVTDPNIEQRTLDEFLPLLLWRASDEDRALINEFVNA